MPQDYIQTYLFHLVYNDLPTILSCYAHVHFLYICLPTTYLPREELNLNDDGPPPSR